MCSLWVLPSVLGTAYLLLLLLSWRGVPRRAGWRCGHLVLGPAALALAGARAPCLAWVGQTVRWAVAAAVAAAPTESLLHGFSVQAWPACHLIEHARRARIGEGDHPDLISGQHAFVEMVDNILSAAGVGTQERIGSPSSTPISGKTSAAGAHEAKFVFAVRRAAVGRRRRERSRRQRR